MWISIAVCGRIYFDFFSTEITVYRQFFFYKLTLTQCHFNLIQVKVWNFLIENREIIIMNDINDNRKKERNQPIWWCEYILLAHIHTMVSTLSCPSSSIHMHTIYCCLQNVYAMKVEQRLQCNELWMDNTRCVYAVKNVLLRSGLAQAAARANAHKHRSFH